MIFALCAMPARGIADDHDSTLKVYWSNGLRLENADKSVKLKIGGRIMNDWAFFDGGSDLEAVTGELEDGTEFRRARLYVAGEVYDHVIFKAQYDFAGGDADFRDVYIGLKDLPYVGTIKVGHFFEPFSLEQLTSSKYITFMERALPNALAFDRNTGIMLQNHVLDQRMTWAAGVFRNSDSFGDSEGENYNYSARVTGLPIFDGDDQLLHVGIAYRHTDPDDDELRIATEPEAHQAPDFIDTRMMVPDPMDPGEMIAVDVAADGVDSVGVELAGVLGPLSLQGEYIHASVDAIGGGSDPDFHGWYVYGSYWLTGEHRKYDAKHGVFGRVEPNSNFLQDNGCGAWEIGVRYSSLDVSDAGVDGGELDDVTVGVNWHLNPNTRVMANYIHAELDERGLASSEDADIFQMRFQIDF